MTASAWQLTLFEPRKDPLMNPIIAIRISHQRGVDAVLTDAGCDIIDEFSRDCYAPGVVTPFLSKHAETPPQPGGCRCTIRPVAAPPADSRRTTRVAHQLGFPTVRAAGVRGGCTVAPPATAISHSTPGLSLLLPTPPIARLRLRARRGVGTPVGPPDPRRH